jgi:hypothetical protein
MRKERGSSLKGEVKDGHRMWPFLFLVCAQIKGVTRVDCIR